MILFNTMTLHNIPRLARIHANLNDSDKRFYHPCKMNLLGASMFLTELYIKSKLNSRTLAITAIDYSYNLMVGFLFLRYRNNKYELGIVINPCHRKAGIGKMLIYRAIEYAKSVGIGRIWLKVLKDNYSAIKLYLDSGFRVIKTSSNNYKGEVREFYEMELKV